MSLAFMVTMVMLAESDGSCEGSLWTRALVTFNTNTGQCWCGVVRGQGVTV